MSQIHDYEQRTSADADSVELMVHGVGGTTPEAMLDSTDIARVCGDATAAFFRLKRDQPDDTYVREAYSWGGLTSGTRSRAFWVFLAPFAFLNVAGWMLPPATTATNDSGATGHHRVATGLLRLIGFTVTVNSIIWIGEFSIDFAAWQCGGNVSCRSTTWLISMFGWGWFDNAPARRLVVGALIPLLVIFVVHVLTRRTVDRYESVDEGALESYEDVVRDSFADPTFWRRGESLSSSASLHLAGAASGLALALAWTFAWLQPTGTPLLQIAIGLFALVLLLISAVGITVFRDTSPEPDDSSRSLPEAFVVWHRRAAMAVVATILAVGVVWPGYEDPGRSSPLDPYDQVWRLVWVVSMFALGAFAIAVLTHPNRTRTVAAPLRAEDADTSVVVGFGSFGSVLAAFLGFLVAVAMLGSLGAATSRVLGGRPTILSTYLYDAFGLVTTAWVLLLLCVFTVMWLLRRPVPVPEDTTPSSSFEEEITHGFAEDRTSFFTGRQRKRKWLKLIRTRRDVRAFLPVAESVLGWMVVVAMVAAVVLLSIQVVSPNTLQSMIERVPSWLVTASTWFVAVGIPIGIVLLLRQALGSRRTRKSIGALWDVVSFWPRWFHPLAPPSYSGRAIPELRTRLDTLANSSTETSGKATIVVTAHSQGSLLALAALDGLGGQPWLSRVSLLTHGSPITRLYVRLFPAHMLDSISRVDTSLGSERWVNVYRLTDPIGGAISGETETHPRGSWQPNAGLPLSEALPDVSSGWRNPVPDPDLTLYSDTRTGSSADPSGASEHVYPRSGDPYPPPLGHSDYKLTPEFQASLRFLGLS